MFEIKLICLKSEYKIEISEKKLIRYFHSLEENQNKIYIDDILKEVIERKFFRKKLSSKKVEIRKIIIRKIFINWKKLKIDIVSFF